MPKDRTSFTLSQEAIRLLEALARYHGISKTAALEMLIREAARERGLEAPNG